MPGCSVLLAHGVPVSDAACSGGGDQGIDGNSAQAWVNYGFPAGSGPRGRAPHSSPWCAWLGRNRSKPGLKRLPATPPPRMPRGAPPRPPPLHAAPRPSRMSARLEPRMPPGSRPASATDAARRAPPACRPARTALKPRLTLQIVKRPIACTPSRYCPAAGSSSGPWRGSPAAAAPSATTNACPGTTKPSCTGP